MGRKESQRKTKYRNAFYIQVLECVLVIAIFVLAYCGAGRLIYNSWMVLGLFGSLGILSFTCGLSILVLGLNGYFSFHTKVFVELAAKVIFSVVLIDLLFIAALYFSKIGMLSPYFFVAMGTMQAAMLLFLKRGTDGLKGRILQKKINLVIGSREQGEDFLEQLSKWCVGRIAYADMDDPKLFEYVLQSDTLFLTGNVDKFIKDKVISCCIQYGKKVSLVPETYEIAMQKAVSTQMGDIPIFEVNTFDLTEAQKLFKRLVDITVSLVGIFLSSPLMLYAVLRIKAEDRGPVLYKQVRSGKSGKEFQVLKFRSMIIDAEKYTGAVFAAANDPRITKIGRLMRATRIDEIPQFFNVLSGDMSIIGPRPERPVFVEEFCKDISEYRNRLAVKPGITGLAQVQGNYTTTPENKLKFDLMYIQNYSLLLDIKILFKTVKVIFTREQAAGFSAEIERIPLTRNLAACAILNADGAAAGSRTLGSYIEREIHEKKNVGAIQNKARKGSRTSRVGKVALIAACCLVVLFSSIFLRYASIITVFAAAMSDNDEAVTAMAAGDLIGERLAFLSDLEEEDGSSDGETSGDAVGWGATEGGEMAGGATDDPNIASFDGPSRKAGNEGRAGSSGVKASESTKGIALTSEQISKSIKELSLVQLIDIFFRFVSKLSKDDLMRLETMARDGFTTEEKEEAKEMMYTYFKDDDVEYIKEMYTKVVG